MPGRTPKLDQALVLLNDLSLAEISLLGEVVLQLLDLPGGRNFETLFPPGAIKLWYGRELIAKIAYLKRQKD